LIGSGWEELSDVVVVGSQGDGFLWCNNFALAPRVGIGLWWGDGYGAVE
jgi:hypothetical protein